MPGVGGGHVFYTIVVPQTTGIAKGRKTTFGADAGAGENEEVIGGSEREIRHGSDSVLSFKY